VIISLPVDRPSAYHRGLNSMAVIKWFIIIPATKILNNAVSYTRVGWAEIVFRGEVHR